ncbi:host attachment protein [Luteibacter jiangsuensis]|uniref:Host attachment protein n=1 Tax=Luteibacter jiangsuensis TaxID=637577 RepID=A0ABX0PXW5_9GAMM|nr:host attachment protein [Luteibacter jiangsuensis]NID03354.1 host attachment protein [Luteibacter jiangsuensis]
MSTIWILACDAARARLFEAPDRKGAWTEVAAYANPELRGPPMALNTGRTVPRSQESVGGARHVIEPRETRKDHSARAFAKHIVGQLGDAHTHRRYTRIFLVAPPRFLGMLCEEIGDFELAGVAGTLGKDIVGLQAETLERHVRAGFPDDFAAEPKRPAA